MRYFIYKFTFNVYKKHIKRHDEKKTKNEILPSNVENIESSFTYNKKEIKYNICHSILNYDKNKYYPVIFHIHGGAWVYGDKDLNTNFHYHLAQEGFKVISISYTLCFKAHLIDQLKEINEFIKHLYLKKDEYKIDLNNLFIIGDSAGGELNFLLNSIYNSKELQNLYDISLDIPIKIKALCLNHPTPYLKDFKCLKDKKFINRIYSYGLKRMLYGNHFKKNKIFHYTDPNEVLPLVKNFPKSIIISSKGDTLFNFEAIKLHEDFIKFNIDHKFLFIENKGAHHVFNLIYLNKKESIDTNKEIINYFKENID